MGVWVVEVGVFKVVVGGGGWCWRRWRRWRMRLMVIRGSVWRESLWRRLVD